MISRLLVAQLCCFALSLYNGAVFAADNSNTTAADINGYKIMLPKVDAVIGRQIAKIQTALSNTVKATLETIINDYLMVSGRVQEANITQSQLNTVLQQHHNEITQVVKRHDTQSEYLKERIARQYLEASNRKTLIKIRQQLEQQGKLTITIPAALQQLEHQLPPQLVLATIGDHRITAASIEKKAALTLYRLRGELYLVRKNTLEKLIEQHLLLQEAKRQNITLTALKDQWNKLEVSDHKVTEYITQQKQFGKDLESARAKPYLKYKMRYEHRTQLLQQLKNTSVITTALKKPQKPRFTINKNLGIQLSQLTKKNQPEKIDIYYFSNFQCNHCRKTQQEIDKLMKQNPEIIVHHLDFVPLADTAALDAAILAHCAAKLGRYHEIRSVLLATQPPSKGTAWLKRNQLDKFIKDNNLHKNTFNECLNDTDIQDKIALETQEALRIGFREPPAFVISEKPLAGLQTNIDLLSNIDEI